MVITGSTTGLENVKVWVPAAGPPTSAMMSGISGELSTTPGF